MFDKIMQVINGDDISLIESTVSEMERLIELGNKRIALLEDEQFYSECVDDGGDDEEYHSEIIWKPCKNYGMIEIYMDKFTRDVNIQILDSEYNVDEEEPFWGLEIKNRSKFNEFADLIKLEVQKIIDKWKYEPYCSEVLDYLDDFLNGNKAHEYVRVTHYPDDEEE